MIGAVTHSFEVRRSSAIVSLVAAGLLWGGTAALSKLSLEWLNPAWLAALRFIVASVVLAFISRRHLRRALSARVLISGAFGYGVAMLLQNIGFAHTSVSHAAIIVGALPAIVALISAGLGSRGSRPLTWLGYGVALLGIVCVARGGGGGASPYGDGLVLVSVAVSGGLIATQPRRLHGQDAGAVTAAQFAAAAALSLPVALISGGLPHAPVSAGPVLAFVALALGGTALAFWLFAFGQKGTSPELAGAIVNLEPLVGAMIGWVGFGDPAGAWQLSGAVVVVIGILLSTVRWGNIGIPPLLERLQAHSHVS